MKKKMYKWRENKKKNIPNRNLRKLIICKSVNKSQMCFKETIRFDLMIPPPPPSKNCSYLRLEGDRLFPTQIT